jgi:hypothetical protein
MPLAGTGLVLIISSLTRNKTIAWPNAAIHPMGAILKYSITLILFVFLAIPACLQAW